MPARCEIKQKFSAEYRTWKGIKTRCFNPKEPGWKYYGGRGITVCERWRNSFQSFVDDMGPKPTPNHTIDRIDPNGNYTPENCRWLLGSLQNRNRRDTVMLTIDGVTKPLVTWAEEFGVPVSRVHKRISFGYAPEIALGKSVVRHDVTLNGKTQTVSTWAREFGLAPQTLLMRVASGQKPADVVNHFYQQQVRKP